MITRKGQSRVEPSFKQVGGGGGVSSKQAEGIITSHLIPLTVISQKTELPRASSPSILSYSTVRPIRFDWVETFFFACAKLKTGATGHAKNPFFVTSSFSKFMCSLFLHLSGSLQEHVKTGFRRGLLSGMQRLKVLTAGLVGDSAKESLQTATDISAIQLLWKRNK